MQRVRKAEEEEHQVKAIGLASQDLMWCTGESAFFEGSVANRPRKTFSFPLQSLTDLLSTQTKLKTSELDKDSPCKQCGRPACPLNHILMGYPKSGGTSGVWHVLTEIGKWVEQLHVKTNKTQARPSEGIALVSKGVQSHKTGTVTKTRPSILQVPSDWEWSVQPESSPGWLWLT